MTFIVRITTTKSSPTALGFEEWAATKDAAATTSLLGKYPECAGKTIQNIIDEYRVQLKAQPGFVSMERTFNADNSVTTSTQVWESQAAFAAIPALRVKFQGPGEVQLDAAGLATVDIAGNPLYFAPLAWLQHCWSLETGLPVTVTTTEHT